MCFTCRSPEHHNRRNKTSLIEPRQAKPIERKICFQVATCWIAGGSSSTATAVEHCSTRIKVVRCHRRHRYHRAISNNRAVRKEHRGSIDEGTQERQDSLLKGRSDNR